MQQLVDYGFRFVGDWRTPQCRVHRVPWLRMKPGIYAFVVGTEVCYIGKAEKLHRRIRNYSNRCFGKPRAKPLRDCHDKIIATIYGGQIVNVYALISTTTLELERKFIREFNPPWNH